MDPKRKRKVILISCIVFCTLIIFAIIGGVWVNMKIQKAKELAALLADPVHVDADELLQTIDSTYRDMSDEERRKILDEPEKVKQFAAAAIKKELHSTFDLLFKLPKPIRTRVIKESAAQLRRRRHEVGKQELDNFFTSSAGQGALQGASNFFTVELSAKQKSEMIPLTEEVYQVIKYKTEMKRK